MPGMLTFLGWFSFVLGFEGFSFLLPPILSVLFIWEFDFFFIVFLVLVFFLGGGGRGVLFDCLFVTS